MKRLSEAITAAGLGIVVLSACCMDSAGDYAYIAGAIGILGGFIAGIGYTVRVLTGKQKGGILYFPLPEEPVADAEWIELQTEK